jgi:hypothetical protein
MQRTADHFVTGLTKSQLQVLDSLGHEAEFEENELIVVVGEESRMFSLLLKGCG